MTILFFGVLADVTGHNELNLENINDTETLQNVLTEKYPELKKYKYRVAVNQEMINGKSVLSSGDTIAIMPPFNGG
jgi:molybdopterin synthase sulfur carrier subunit